MKRILITGATGAVGIPLVQHLHSKNFKVSVLVRPRKNLQTEVGEMFGFVPTIVEGDITLDGCGINSRALENLTGNIDLIIHAAGKVQYHEQLRNDTYLTNETGTRNCLELASLLQTRRFLYVSTAYVGGCQAYLGEHEFGRYKYANNPYESSKQAAEKLVNNWSAGQAVIVRPSTIRIRIMPSQSQRNAVSRSLIDRILRE